MEKESCCQSWQRKGWQRGCHPALRVTFSMAVKVFWYWLMRSRRYQAMRAASSPEGCRRSDAMSMRSMPGEKGMRGNGASWPHPRTQPGLRTQELHVQKNITTAKKETHGGLGGSGISCQAPNIYIVLLKTRFLCAAQAHLNLQGLQP